VKLLMAKKPTSYYDQLSDQLSPDLLAGHERSACGISTARRWVRNVANSRYARIVCDWRKTGHAPIRAIVYVKKWSRSRGNYHLIKLAHRSSDVSHAHDQGSPRPGPGL